MTKIIKTIAASLLVLVLAGSAQAALVNFELTGTVTTAVEGNPFGLDTTGNNTITASGVYDDSGDGTLGISINDITFNVGSLTFTNAMDIWGGADLYLLSNNQVFDGIDYAGTDQIGTYFDSYSLLGTFASYDIDGSGSLLLEGSWDSFSVTAVPVPAAVWLFGSGLLALVGLSRRK